MAPLGVASRGMARRCRSAALDAPSASAEPPPPKRVRLEEPVASPGRRSIRRAAASPLPRLAKRVRLEKPMPRCFDALAPAAVVAPRPGVGAAARSSSRSAMARSVAFSEEVTCLPGRTMLETVSVGPATRKQYLMVLWMLASWGMGASTRAMTGCPEVPMMKGLKFLIQLAKQDWELDDLVAGFLDSAFWEGAHSLLAGRVRSALGWLLPKFQKHGDGHLPRLAQSKLAAERRSPGSTPLPLPEEFIYATVMIVAFLLEARGLPPDAAMGLMLAHHCYLRPGELSRVLWKMIVPGSGTHRHKAVVVLHPAEARKPSKTGEFDETVVIDLPWLATLILKRRLLRNANSRVVGIPMLLLQEIFKEAQVKLGIAAVLGLRTLYVLRHSGASSDAWEERRDLSAIQRRGRWRAASSVRRYEKGGRLAEQLARCSAQMQQFAAMSMARLPLVLDQRCVPSMLR